MAQDTPHVSRIPLHHCPVCDRVKRAVRTNTARIAAHLAAVSRASALGPGDIAALCEALRRALFLIDECFSVRHLKAVVPMDEAAADAYLARFCTDDDPRPPAAALPGRPRLTIIQGGRS